MLGETFSEIARNQTTDLLEKSRTNKALWSCFAASNLPLQIVAISSSSREKDIDLSAHILFQLPHGTAGTPYLDHQLVVMVFWAKVADFAQKGIALTCFMGSLVLLTLAGRGSYIAIQRRKELAGSSAQETAVEQVPTAELVRESVRCYFSSIQLPYTS